MWTPRCSPPSKEKPKDGDAPEIDPFEAMKVIEQLSLAEVDDVVPDGESFMSPFGSWVRRQSTC